MAYVQGNPYGLLLVLTYPGEVDIEYTEIYDADVIINKVVEADVTIIKIVDEDVMLNKIINIDYEELEDNS